jgi:multidrug resistance efflux pump
MSTPHAAAPRPSGTRIARRLAATLACAAAAGFGLYVVVGERLAGASSDAVINAQLVTLRSPVDGDLTLGVRSLGAHVRPRQVVATVADPRADDNRLLDLQRSAAEIATETERLEATVAALTIARRRLQEQADEYRDGRLRQLQTRLAEARAMHEAAQARMREAEAALRRANDLGRGGYQTVADVGRARAAFEVGTQETEAAQSRIRFLAIELDAAQRGVFLGDSWNDSPQSQQRIREIELRIAETEAALAQQIRRGADIEKRLDEERLRLARRSAATLTSPAPAALWDLLAADGEHVRRGQDLARLVDCGSTIVTASVRETVYNGLRVGAAAQFRLLDDGRVFPATVLRLAGSGAESIYRNLAIGAGEEHLKRYDVALEVPALAADPELACAVGRTGRVVFTSRPLDGWRRFLAMIGLG